MKHDNRIFVNGEAKEAGQIKGDRLVIVKTSRNHFVKKYRGYGISPETFDAAEQRGIVSLQLIGYDGETFNLSIKDYRLAAIPADLGAGVQLFLSVKSLRYYTRRQPAYNEPISAPQQMGLFG